MSAFVSYVLSGRAENRRAHRDYITGLFDRAADAVREAAQAGVTYFSNSTVKNFRLHEAEVMLFESEIRTDLSMITESLGLNETEAADMQTYSGSFLDELTGGDFSSGSPIQDVPRCSRIAGRGAALRGLLLRIRQAQLKAATEARISQIYREMTSWGRILLLLSLGMLAIYIWLIIQFYKAVIH